MKRRRHEDRVAGVNARFRRRSEGATISHGTSERPTHETIDEFRDRLRYGGCGGFGAPQARRTHERTEKS